LEQFPLADQSGECRLRFGVAEFIDQEVELLARGVIQLQI
jgi:hypothetical protein